MLHDNDNALRGQKHLLELDDVWVTEQRVVDDLPLHVPVWWLVCSWRGVSKRFG